MRKPQKCITAVMGEDITQRILAGQTREQIGFIHDVDPSSISYFAKRNNIIKPKRKVQKDFECAELGCARPCFARGYCTMHYNRRQVNGEFGHSPRDGRGSQPRPFVPEKADRTCDHASSSCRCLNRGHNYSAYVKS